MAIAIAAATSLTVNAQMQNMQPYSGKSPREVRQVMRPEGISIREGNISSNIPEDALTEQQREELKKIRMERMKESTKTRNLLREKRARLETLQTADKPDMKEINKVIDEIAAIQAQEMKTQAAARQKIRSLLTEEQRAYFDARSANSENMRAPGASRNEGQVPLKNERFRGMRGERPSVK